MPIFLAPLRQFSSVWVSTTLVLLFLRELWLITLAEHITLPAIGGLMIEVLARVPSVLFQLLAMFGLLIFAIAPALAEGRWASAGGHGAALATLGMAAGSMA